MWTKNGMTTYDVLISCHRFRLKVELSILIDLILFLQTNYYISIVCKQNKSAINI